LPPAAAGTLIASETSGCFGLPYAVNAYNEKILAARKLLEKTKEMTAELFDQNRQTAGTVRLEEGVPACLREIWHEEHVQSEEKIVAALRPIYQDLSYYVCIVADRYGCVDLWIGAANLQGRAQETWSKYRRANPCGTLFIPKSVPNNMARFLALIAKEWVARGRQKPVSMEMFISIMDDVVKRNPDVTEQEAFLGY
jgi:hypothetical protein